MSKHRTDDDDFLRDGERMRVPVMLRDAAPQWTNDAEDHFGRQVRVTDAHSGARGLHRPGFRAFTDGGAQFADRAALARQLAHDAYDYDLANAWRTPAMADLPPTGAGSHGQAGSLSAAIEQGRELERQRQNPPPKTPKTPRSAEPPDDDDDWDDDGDDLDDDPDDEDDDDDADAIVARTTTHSESGWPSERAYRQARGGRRAGREARAAAPASDHAVTMGALYRDYDADLQNAWRRR